MPDDPGMVGYGSTVEISVASGPYVRVEGIFDLTLPTPTINNPQAPSMQLPDNAMQRVPGKVIDYGQVTFSLAWIPGSDADDLLQGLVTLGDYFSVRETLPNGINYTISGLFNTMTPAVPWDDRMTAAVTIDTSGAPTLGTASAPTNTVKPSIAGSAVQVGVLLTADEGVWTGAPTFTYQWKKAGSPISGATAKTYTPVVGEVGTALSVTVTGTNQAGNAAATSLATTNVLAA